MLVVVVVVSVVGGDGVAELVIGGGDPVHRAGFELEVCPRPRRIRARIPRVAWRGGCQARQGVPGCGQVRQKTDEAEAGW